MTINIRFHRIPLHRIAIIGIEGSGKTTLARYLYSLYKWGRHNPAQGRIVKSVYFQYDRDLQDELFETIESLDEATHVYVVIDDLTFAISNQERQFLNRISKIRHYNKKVRRWVLVFIMHFSKGTRPYLRQAHGKFVTSLIDPVEIEGLSESYRLEILWDYYHVYRENPAGHWTLVNWFGDQFITRFKRPRARCWDIVVNGPPCV